MTILYLDVKKKDNFESNENKQAKKIPYTRGFSGFFVIEYWRQFI